MIPKKKLTKLIFLSAFLISKITDKVITLIMRVFLCLVNILYDIPIYKYLFQKTDKNILNS